MDKAVGKLRTDEMIYRHVLYYSFFNYPIKHSELCDALKSVFDKNTLSNEIQSLITSGTLVNKDEYLGVREEQLQIEQRLADEARLAKAQLKIERAIRVISRFPFVKSIMISGSVSKGVLKEDGDVDFFIITKQNRLWLTRTMLILNKKLLRFNSRKFFCVNYFLGENSLAIPDENMFTAIELNTLLPVYNPEVYAELLSSNRWSERYVSSNTLTSDGMKIEAASPTIKRFGEWMFRGALGEGLDKSFKRLTLKRWKRKFAHFGDEEFDLAMRSERNVSKHHPSNFQIQLLNYIESGMADYNMKSQRPDLHKP